MTQKEQIGEELKKIAKDVTTSDRKLYMKENEPVTNGMISTYFSGKVSNIERGLEMLKFFKIRVQARAQQIESLSL